MSSTHSKYHIGIDLGTTNCSVAVFENGRVKVIEDIQGNRRIPSYVAFTDSEYLVGFPARNQVDMNSSNTVHNVKRLLGRKFDDPELESDMKYWPFSVIDEKGRPIIQVQYKKEAREFCPEEITALILTEMKEMAESHIGEKSGVVDVVISVPANFNNLQRKATMDAAHIAGLNVLHLMNDSTAAALAYCIEKKITDPRNILVLDLGGGSFDVSMVSIQGSKLDVKAVSGETHLGGEDFVNNMLSHIAEDFQQNELTDSTRKTFLARLKIACEVAKKELSKLPQASIAVEGCDCPHKVNTEMFNTYNDKLYNKIMEHVDKVVMASGVGKDPFIILLIGGCTRVPKIEELLKTKYSGVQISKGINCDEAVAYGAAVQAALLHGDESDAIKHIVELQDMKPKSLFVRQGGTNMRICIPEHSNMQPLVPIRYSMPGPNQNIDVKVQLAIGANGVLKFIHSSQEEIIDDENCISKEIIDIMKKTAQDLKDDCKLHKERMQLRNNLEESIIRVQAKFRKLDNKDDIMGRCESYLHWMNINEAAKTEEYEEKDKYLKSLLEQNLPAVTSSRTLPAKIVTTSEISKTDPKSVSTRSLSDVQLKQSKVDSLQNETNIASIHKLKDSQERPSSQIDSTSHDISEIASEIGKPPTPLDSNSHDSSNGASETAVSPPSLDSTSHDTLTNISENDRPPPPLHSTSHDALNNVSVDETVEPPPQLESTSHDTPKSISENDILPQPLDLASHESSKGASQIDSTIAPLDSTSRDTSKSVSETFGPPPPLDSRRHNSSKSATQIDRPPPKLDSTSHDSSMSATQIDKPPLPSGLTSDDTSKSAAQINRPPKPSGSRSHDNSKSATEIDKHPTPSGSKSHDNSKSAAQIDKPSPQSGSKSHDKSKSGSAHEKQKIPQKDSTLKQPEQKPAAKPDKWNATGSENKEVKPKKPKRDCTIS